MINMNFLSYLLNVSWNQSSYNYIYIIKVYIIISCKILINSKFFILEHKKNKSGSYLIDWWNKKR